MKVHIIRRNFTKLLIISLVQFLCKFVLVLLLLLLLLLFYLFFPFFALNIIFTLIIWIDGPAQTEKAQIRCCRIQSRTFFYIGVFA